MHKRADSSLSNAEKEDREIERLINKKPAPSRKNREKRGPKHDNRRRVMETEKDPDLSTSDSDLSGGNKYSFDNFLGEDMVVRTSGYHGIVERGNTGDMEESLQQARVFDALTEDDHKVLISAAKKAMKEEWFKAGWGEDPTDAPTRAALDQSIATASNSIYAQRVDSMTYNLLLGKLLGEEIDQSVDAFFDEGLGLTRSEFKMDKDNVLHLASKLRHSNPRLAMDLVRRTQIAADPMPGAIDDELKSEMDKKIKELIDTITDEDIEAFGEKMKEMSSLFPKTASRTASEFLEFTSLADMSAEDLAAFFDKTRKSLEKSKKELEKNDVEEFLITFDSIFKDSEDAAKKGKQGSVRVNLATLIRVASTSDEARAMLLPVLAAAKKKLKKPAKTSTKEKPAKDEKPGKKDEKPAKPGKKEDKKPAKKEDKKPAKKDPKSNLAPPFKKKASFQSDDLDW